MSLRILVVEDYAPFRRITCAALQRRAEFEIFEAADGLETLQKAEALQPDVILLDITAATDLLPAIDAVLAGHRFVSRGLAFTEPIDAPVSRRHEILFCPDDAAVVDGLARCISAALNAQDGAIVVATEPHQVLLLARLRTLDVDIDRAIARRTFISLDADQAADERFVEAAATVREAAARAGNAQPRVALCGERAGRLWAEGRTAEAIQLERLCSELPRDIDILCVYPAPYTDDDQALMRICSEHTVVSAR